MKKAKMLSKLRKMTGPTRRPVEEKPLLMKGQIIANKLNISIHSVETFRQRIYTKSGMRNIAELVKWAVENDLVD